MEQTEQGGHWQRVVPAAGYDPWGGPSWQGTELTPLSCDSPAPL